MDAVDEILEIFELSVEALRDLQKRLVTAMEDGLVRNDAAVLMIPAYVHQLPDGTERGQFLALDLGGTNFRVLLITLLADRQYSQEMEDFGPVPKEKKTSSQEVLFDYIADCLKEFLTKHGIKNRLPLGYTFSFPVEQTALAEGTLVQWNKGFDASGAPGRDVVGMLNDALKRKEITQVDVVALVNDTTGTMMSCALEDPECRIGLILGTGTNACYMERLSAIEKWHHSPRLGITEVAVNTEWGGFGDTHELDDIFNDFDRQLDVNVPLCDRGRQQFEKAISGMYLGELVRLVGMKLHSEGLLFKGRSHDDLAQFREPWTFETKFMSDAEAKDEKKSLQATRANMETLGVSGVSVEDFNALRQASRAVSQRAARFTAAGIATLVERICTPGESCTVAVDGTLYKLHPTLQTNLKECLNDLLQGRNAVKLVEAEDGSGRGAALIAAVAVRMASTSDLEPASKTARV